MQATRHLLLLRYAKLDGARMGQADFDRPLNEHGRQTVMNMALLMQNEHLVPEEIVSSDAERARETTLALCRFSEIDSSIISWRHSIYEASLETLLNVVAQTSEKTHTLLLVGHNPGIERLVRHLADESLQQWTQGHLIPIAALCHLSFSGLWRDISRACSVVNRIARPRQLFNDL